MNASVGDPETSIVTDAALVERYRRAVARRLQRDLVATFGEVPAADADYFLLAERPDHYLAVVVRVTHTSPDGAWSEGPGLMYWFDKGSDEVRGVRRSDY
jgi:hypothetical protein